MKHKKTTNKVTQCEDGNPDCFHTPEPVEEMSFQSRLLGKSYKGWLMFVAESMKGHSVVYATPKGDILSPKAVENLLAQERERICKLTDHCEVEMDSMNSGERWKRWKQLRQAILNPKDSEVSIS